MKNSQSTELKTRKMKPNRQDGGEDFRLLGKRHVLRNKRNRKTEKHKWKREWEIEK